MKLENLRPAAGAVRNNDRLGRGQGSGGGGTAKRGHKGAKSRSGYSSKRGFEGGQMPLQRRVPKFGFNNINRVEYKGINLDTLQALVEKTGANTITLDFLNKNGLIAKFDLVKILGRGEISSAVTVQVNAFSKSAVEAIEKAGGKAIVFEKGTKSIEVSETTTESAKPKAAKKAAKGDDLKLIEGVGPKIADLLISAGIDTFAKLAVTEAQSISDILAEAGSNFASHNPATWGEQAQLAADGKWDELKELQDKLNGGRPE